MRVCAQTLCFMKNGFDGILLLRLLTGGTGRFSLVWTVSPAICFAWLAKRQTRFFLDNYVFLLDLMFDG